MTHRRGVSWGVSVDRIIQKLSWVELTGQGCQDTGWRRSRKVQRVER